MKTPEELKAQAIDESGCCGTCEYYGTTYDNPFGCAEAQAKTMIVQELVEYTNQLESRLAQAEQERDVLAAALEGDKFCGDCLHLYSKDQGRCLSCAQDRERSKPLWKWRGVCPENTKEE